MSIVNNRNENETSPTTTTSATSKASTSTSSTMANKLATDNIEQMKKKTEGAKQTKQQQPPNEISSVPLAPKPSNINSIITQRAASYESDLYVFDDLRASESIMKGQRKGRKSLKSFIDLDDDEDEDVGVRTSISSADGGGRRREKRRSNGSTDNYGQELVNVFNNVQLKEEEEWANFNEHCDKASVSELEANKTRAAPLASASSIASDQTNTTTTLHDDHRERAFKSMEDEEAEGQEKPRTTVASIEEEKEHEYNEEDEEEDVFDPETNFTDQQPSELLFSRLQFLEEEQDVLNNSLLALTSHFAQVQLRLRQIVEAKDLDAEKRESMLRELEAFANRGIPELMLRSNAGQAGGGSKLERSISMATSIMADDVFEDDGDAGGSGEEHERRDSMSCASSSKSRLMKDGDDADDEATDATDRQFSDIRKAWSSAGSTLVTEDKLERQRFRQKQLIEQLKEQLEDLERYAYETGELSSLPSSMLMERQQVIIEQIKSKLPVLSIDEIDKCGPEELRKKVDVAVRELVNPVLMKEQLVAQLKTQVSDLERFIIFLQEAGVNAKHLATGKDANTFAKMSRLFKKTQATGPNKHNDRQLTDTNGKEGKEGAKGTNQTNKRKETQAQQQRQADTEKAANIMRRIISLLNMFTWAHFGMCSNFGNQQQQQQPRRPPPRRTFERNILKRNPDYGRHWGDLRAAFELSVDSILEFYREKNLNDSDYTSDNDDAFHSERKANSAQRRHRPHRYAYEQMNMLVRKDLAASLRNLIQHGLIGCYQSDASDVYRPTGLSLCPSSHGGGSGNQALASSSGPVSSLLSMGLGCFSSQNGSALIKKSPSHAWELILYYYDLKNGNEFCSSPTRRLSQSFGQQVLQMHGRLSKTQAQASVSPKHSLLAAIDDIIDTHTRTKRSLDSHFKAFVCVALNQRLLGTWLRLILRNTTLVSECYENWSYTASTGFDDALRQLDKLSQLRFVLPTNLAVKQVQSMNDAF